MVVGSVLGDSSQRAIQCRVASLLSGIPSTVAVHTVNRCAFRACFERPGLVGVSLLGVTASLCLGVKAA